MDSEELDVMDGSDQSPGHAEKGDELMRGESSSQLEEGEGCSDDPDEDEISDA